MDAPELWYRVDFQPGVANKLSFHPPYNECTITISCNQHIKTFLCRSTFGDEPTGKDLGILLVQFTNRDANVQIPFTIDAFTACTKGEGEYKFSLYVENDEGIWNIYQLFLTTESDGTHLTLQDSDSKDFLVEY